VILFRSAEIDVLPGFERLNPGLETQFVAVATDSRDLPANALFLALRGEHFDGHDFLPAALAAGACGAVLSAVPAELPPIPVWRVADTLQALGDLARLHRDRYSIPVLALTGTSGKTTTKEILRSIFSQRSPLVNEGNFNNLVGVPKTLFRLTPEHDYAIVEIGMNQFGEIGRLTEIVHPTLGLINNVGPGHLAGVGDLEGVLRAKTELAREMEPGRPIILNADDPLLRRFGQGAQRPVIWFGLQSGSQYSAKDVVEHGLDGQSFMLCTPQGEQRLEMSLPGEHNLRNALAAAAAAMTLGLPLDEVASGIARAEAFRMRAEVLEGPNGSRIISDCYNANPASMREALRLLKGAKGRGRSAAVLADMLELGESARDYHEELGKQISAAHPDRVWLVGEWAAVVSQAATGVETVLVQDLASLADEIKAWLQPGDTLLVKGSRGMQLDRIVGALR
jgi:UDP-N-acetylmuramoyl-tripeptide--D-alanyl-D-alanine ligase